MGAINLIIQHCCPIVILVANQNVINKEAGRLARSMTQLCETGRPQQTYHNALLGAKMQHMIRQHPSTVHTSPENEMLENIAFTLVPFAPRAVSRRLPRLGGNVGPPLGLAEPLGTESESD